MPGPVLREVELPIFDLRTPRDLARASGMVRTLSSLGLFGVRSPFVNDGDSAAYRGMMDRYYTQPLATIARDERPEFARQVGVLLPNTEDFSGGFFRDRPEVQALVGDRAPYPCTGPNRHMRFFHRYGQSPPGASSTEGHAPNVIPQGFPEWQSTMDTWGTKLLQTGVLIMRDLELGFGLPSGVLSNMLQYGPHLISPTAIDLAGLPIGTVTSDIHSDFNPLTLHGAARYSTLIAWTREGVPFLVRVPTGCLLCQAGVGLEYVTGGEIRAGYHQTVVTPEVYLAVMEALARGESTIRCSSTFFLHFNWQLPLRVFPRFWSTSVEALYPPTTVGTHAMDVIRGIGLTRQRSQ